MIRHFTDHAANERTFLAWVRTAIAVMAFGFLVAKFNLFLKVAAQSLSSGRNVTIPGGGIGGLVGIVLTLSGTAMVVVAAVRFVRTRQAIDSQEPRDEGARAALMLAGLMVLLGIALVLYLAHTVATGI